LCHNHRSDNSLTADNERRNFRYYTCILYCNDDWDSQRDGGALRIYPGTSDVDPEHAEKHYDYIDINPSNGRLLIFDSKLIHSVETVTQSRHERRALTLWILRPEDGGVEGDRHSPGQSWCV